jgi:hypothetical protein
MQADLLYNTMRKTLYIKALPGLAGGRIRRTGKNTIARTCI